MTGPVRITARRTIGMIGNAVSSHLTAALFLAAAGALFAFHLDAAEGGNVPLAAVWTLAASQALPFLAAVFGMDVWSEERRSGRIDLLLSVPVSEWDFTLGKFLGTWMLLSAVTLVFLVSTLAALACFAPALAVETRLLDFLPGLFILLLQGALWSAVASAASAAFRHAAAAAVSALALTVALPRAVWQALMNWSSAGRTAYGEMPLDAHAFDCASGLISTGTVAFYVLSAVAALLVANLLVSTLRCAGRGGRSRRRLARFNAVLALALCTSLVMLAARFDTTLDVSQLGAREAGFSARARVLADTRGEISVIAFLSRKDPKFRTVARFLRALAQESSVQGGAKISLAYVDPQWDVGPAERLVREGMEPGSVVFRRGRRLSQVKIGDGFGERSCISAILSIAMPPQRRSVCWTSGHGEAQFSDYGDFGLSNIARDLTRDGYRNLSLDLAGETQIPADCALLVVAGAKREFSRAETARLDSYLRQGGRLLVLLTSADAGALTTMMSAWGIRATAANPVSPRTLSGTDLIVSDFSDHAVSSPFKGSQIVLEKPVAFVPSAAASGVGADRISFDGLAGAGGVWLAAIAERGVGAGADLAIRPTRLVAIGDAAFVMNGYLGDKANANRDFFLNCVAYLSGTDAMTEPGAETDILLSGMDRDTRRRFVIVSCIAMPAVVFLFLLAVLMVRRRRR